MRPELRRDLGGISRRDRGTRHGAHDFIVSAYKVRARLRGVRLACVAAQRGPRLRRLRCVPFFFFFLAIFFLYIYLLNPRARALIKVVRASGVAAGFRRDFAP